MALTNTPLHTIETLQHQIDFHKSEAKPIVRVTVETLQKLLNDAKHLNELNAKAMKMGYDGPEEVLDMARMD